jgi:hypothetical protein
MVKKQTSKKIVRKKSAGKKKMAKKAIAKKVSTKRLKMKSTPKVNLQNFLDEVRKRAYEIFLQRGATYGNDLDDWLKAEKEIKQKYGIK